MIDFYFSLQDLEAGKPPTPTLNPRRFHMPSSEATGGLLLAAASRAARALEALPDPPPAAAAADGYIAPAYEVPPGVRWLHLWPRWGRSDQVLDLLGLAGVDVGAGTGGGDGGGGAGAGVLGNEYLAGIVLGGIITGIVLLVWGGALWTLACLGPRRVGCASGRARRPPEPPSTPAAKHGRDDRALEGREDRSRRHDRRIRASRVTFLTAGAGLVLSAGLFYAMGVRGLWASVTDLQGSLELTEDVLAEARDVAAGLAGAGAVAAGRTGGFVDAAGSTCELGAGGIDPAAAVALGPERAAAVEAARATLEGAVGAVLSFDGSVASTARSLEGDLGEAIALTQAASDAMELAYPCLYGTAAFMGLVVLVALVLVADVAVGQKRDRGCFGRCVSSWIVLPVFYLLNLLCWLCATLFQLAAIAGADWCVDPDGHTSEVLRLFVSGKVTPVLLSYLTYYVSCEGEPLDLLGQAQPLYNATAGVHAFLDQVATPEGGEAMAALCGTDGTAIMQDLAGSLHGNLHDLYGTLGDGLDLFRCSTWHPIYAGAMHSGICVHGASGLSWMFATLLCIGICSMIMITLRAATREVGRDGGGNPGPGPGPYVEDAGNDYRPYDPSSSPRFDRASPRRVPRGMSFEEEGEEEARPGYHREIDPIDESRYL